MTTGLLFVLLMAISLVVLVVVAKWPVSLSLAATSVLILLLAGDGGLHVDKLVEGMFGYLDVGLVLITAMIFMKFLEASGLLAELTRAIIITFGRSPLGLLVALTVVIMFPGMITGSCTASVLGTGAIVAPILVEMGLPLLTLPIARKRLPGLLALWRWLATAGAGIDVLNTHSSTDSWLTAAACSCAARRSNRLTWKPSSRRRPFLKLAKPLIRRLAKAVSTRIPSTICT